MGLDFDYQFTRPWLELYYVRLPAPPVKEYEPAPIEHLPDDVLEEVFSYLDVHSLVRVMGVCRKWSAVGKMNRLWRPFCLKAWRFEPVDVLEGLVMSQYSTNWRRMYIERPRIRFEGLYISKNSYVRTSPEGKAYSSVMLVSYFRYLRFYEDGKVLSLITANKPDQVYKKIRANSKYNGLCEGHYTLTDRTVEVYATQRLETHPNMRPYMTLCVLQLGSTVKGANNRLKPQSLDIIPEDGSQPVPIPNIPQTYQFISLKALDLRAPVISAELAAH